VTGGAAECRDRERARVERSPRSADAVCGTHHRDHGSSVTILHIEWRTSGCDFAPL